MSKHLHVGARVSDISWDQAVSEVGPLKVTRVFHDQLPTKYSREGYPEGVKLIVSFKDKSTNVAAYAKSIPSGEDVELVYHHEAENDYSDGKTFVAEFNTAQHNAQSANPNIKFGFIAGGYQYRTGKNGYSGSFIPPNANRYYLDSYQPYNLSSAEQTPEIQRYINLLKTNGKNFHGFTEYGRGAVDSHHPFTASLVTDRLKVFTADEAYLRSLPDVRVWSYWYTDDSKTAGTNPVKQWRLTDTKSKAAWKAIANR